MKDRVVLNRDQQLLLIKSVSGVGSDHYYSYPMQVGYEWLNMCSFQSKSFEQNIFIPKNVSKYIEPFVGTFFESGGVDSFGKTLIVKELNFMLDKSCWLFEFLPRHCHMEQGNWV